MNVSKAQELLSWLVALSADVEIHVAVNEDDAEVISRMIRDRGFATYFANTVTGMKIVVSAEKP